jgi:hypothetical protein
MSVDEIYAIAALAAECESAWNKDPVFGVIGIQSGPRDGGTTVASAGDTGARSGMLVVETIAKIRRAYFAQNKPIKKGGINRPVSRWWIGIGRSAFGRGNLHGEEHGETEERAVNCRDRQPCRRADTRTPHYAGPDPAATRRNDRGNVSASS